MEEDFLDNEISDEYDDNDSFNAETEGMTEIEREAYKWYLDRLSMPMYPRKLTEEEIEELRRQGRI